MPPSSVVHDETKHKHVSVPSVPSPHLTARLAWRMSAPSPILQIL